jgi:hypothetical protein
MLVPSRIEFLSLAREHFAQIVRLSFRFENGPGLEERRHDLRYPGLNGDLRLLRGTTKGRTLSACLAGFVRDVSAILAFLVGLEGTRTNLGITLLAA